MRLRLGSRIALDGRPGVVSEVVPAGQLPRTVTSARAPRGRESYVVTVLAPRRLEVRSYTGDGLGLKKTAASLGCRRLWPETRSITAPEAGNQQSWLRGPVDKEE